MEGKEEKKRLSLISVAIIIALIVIIVGNIFTKIKNKVDKANYNSVEGLDEYIELLKSEDGNFIFIDTNKKIYKFDGYSSMSNFYFNTACVSTVDNTTNKKTYALIDKNENEIIPYGTYDYITQYDDGKFYQVEKNGKQGVINYEGKVIIPVEYNIVSDHKSGTKVSVHAFSCKDSNNIYHYINENGSEYTSSSKYEAVGFYTSKENSSAVAVNILGELYNSKTCEKICTLSKVKRFSDNIITYDNKYEVYDLDLKLVETRECPNATNIVSTSYDGIYSIIEITLDANATEEEKANRFILYDENGKAIITSRDGIAIHKINDKYYFLSEDDSNVHVLNDKGKEIFVANNHKLPVRYSDSFYFAIPKIGVSQYDIYNKNGRLVQTSENIRSELSKPNGDTQRDYMLVTVGLKEGGYNTYIMLKDLTTIQVESTVGIIEKYKDNILTSDSKTKEVNLYYKNRKVGDTIAGVRKIQIGTYSVIENLEEGTYSIIDLSDLSIKFTFNHDELVKIHTNVGIIELASGLYDLDGKNIL